jgi:hypothetical protein
LGRRHSSSDSSTDGPASPDGGDQQSEPPAEQQQPPAEQQQEQPAEQQEPVEELGVGDQAEHVVDIQVDAQAVAAAQAALQALPAGQGFAAFLQGNQQVPAQQAPEQQQQQAPGSPRSDTSSQEGMQA